MGIYDQLKILEFGAGAATPLASRYFAEQGARVIRVESAKRPDFLRTLNLTPQNPHGLDGAPMFILLNPQKESVAIDLTKPEGPALVKKLVAWADVLTENFSPGVMAKFGLDYPSLSQIKPDLIMISGCLFGQTGPERSYPGFGGQSSAIGGFNHLTGWPDRESLGPFGTISDSLAARYVGVAVAAALLERKRTGKGRFIDMSQIEACIYSLSEIVVRQSANGESVERAGNRDQTGAPHGVYPCKGDDRFIAISIFSDAEWQTLREISGITTSSNRHRHQDEIDAALAKWTAQHDANELMAKLQNAGIEAGMVAKFEDLLTDPQLKHRQHFAPIKHDHYGEMQFEYSGIKFSDSPRKIEKPGPHLGQHTDKVLKEILGLDEQQLASLRSFDVLS